MTLELPQAIYGGERYEYSVLVTSLGDEVLTLAQHYRDRGDAENNFDELKNQWGWAGFTTRDSRRGDGAHYGTHLQLVDLKVLFSFAGTKTGGSG